MNRIRRVKRSMLTCMVRSPSFSDSDNHPFPTLIKRLHRKHDIKPSIIMDHTTVVQKGSEHQLCQKTRKRKEAIISDRYPALLQQDAQQQVNTLAEALAPR